MTIMLRADIEKIMMYNLRGGTVTAWAGLALVSRAVREERGKYNQPPRIRETANRYNEKDGVSKRVHELAFGIVICFVAKSFTWMPRCTRRRHCMHQHLQPLSSSSFAPVDLQAFPTVESFPFSLILPAVNHPAPPPSPGAGIVPLVADCLTQLSAGLIITPATISSPAALPALQRLLSTPDAQLATLLPL